MSGVNTEIRIILWDVTDYVDYTHHYVRYLLFKRFWTPFVKLTPRRNPYMDMSTLPTVTWREILKRANSKVEHPPDIGTSTQREREK